MTFLAPWALAIGTLAAAAAVVLHLVARQRPAMFLLPTTRFIPDQRTLVSRIATRPRDLPLLAVRVLLLLVVGAAFARPVITPSRGALARIVLLDRSRSVANPAAAASRVRALAADGVAMTIIAFDSVPTTIAATMLDSAIAAPRTRAAGSISAALIAARRASASLAERADSVQLVLVSPLAASAIDSATIRLRRTWPGVIRLERVPLLAATDTGWRLERLPSVDDPLGPAARARASGTAGRVTRLVRGAATAADSAFVVNGNTVVRWDTTSGTRAVAQGLLSGDDVIVAAVGRAAIPADGRALARWADGTPAAVESRIGDGCMRHVGIVLPAAGDLPLHPPFQRMARELLTPCGVEVTDRLADSAAIASLAGAGTSAASASALRDDGRRPSPLVPWLLSAAILLALTELAVRSRTREADA